MPGSFAHIALADSFCLDNDALESVGGLSPQIKRALLTFTNFCELGAVSPDYPYLRLLDDNAAGWANVMHYWKTADFIRNGVRRLYDSGIGASDSPEEQRCMAWLFGYATHVVADLTVHPVIQMKVGPYEQNKTAHRVCEMNQDVYIFPKVTGMQVASADYLRRAGIATCGDRTDRHKLDTAIAALWTRILADVPFSEVHFTGIQAPGAPPDPDEWHHRFIEVVDNVVKDGKALPFLSRHFAEEEGLIYPGYQELQRDYIDNLTTPQNVSTAYDEVFAFAQRNVGIAWAELGQALVAREPALFTLANGNLDTGMADTGAESASIYWKALALRA
jgi:hypothetical protein